MQCSSSAHQAERRDQSKKTKYMVTVQMTDKYMIDFPKPDLEFSQLYLCSLTTVD
jgi:hypothetical protein